MNLKELSALLGLSQTTVSRALNGYPEVSETTRARVVQAADLHGYSPNTRAQGLATGHSKCIGHVISVRDSAEMVNPIFGDFMAGAGETYAKHGYDMMVTRVGAAEEADTYRNLKARGAVDGVVVHAPGCNDVRLALLDEIGLPFVVHGRSTGVTRPYAWLDVNNTQAFEEATAYLIELGHSRIALVNGQETMDFAIRRRSGYSASLQKAGLTTDPTLMSTGEMTEAYGHEQASTMLQLADPPTAFLAASIICASGIRRALDERGLRVGQDVSIVTFDDCLSYFANGGEKPVFTAWQSSVRAAGAVLAQMLINQIDDPNGALATELWQAQFVQGHSSGPLRQKV